jgi:hypothetical protein
MSFRVVCANYVMFFFFWDVALASAWCVFYGDDFEDVCNLSTTPSSGASPCCDGKWSSWSYWVAVAYAAIHSPCYQRAFARTQASACTSWSRVWWPRFVFVVVLCMEGDNYVLRVNFFERWNMLFSFHFTFVLSLLISFVFWKGLFM